LKQSQLELFNDITARNQFLAQVRQKAIQAIGLEISEAPGTHFERVVIPLPDLDLRGTPDTEQTRDLLASRIIGGLKEQVNEKSITRLSSEAVRIEVGRWSPSVQYQLVATVWY
jgi:hypothetical protein